jgi:hypothetical protein
MRCAAATFPETAHLGPGGDKEQEHREKYAHGKGYYLKDGYWDRGGWAVDAVDWKAERTLWHLPVEDHLDGDAVR